MRAVNLIPSDQRAGGSVGAGRSGGAAYGVLALFVAIAALAVLYGKAHREVETNAVKAATASAAAQRAQSEASALAPYASFVTLRNQREQAVASLVDSRFDWAHAFHEFGRVLSKQTEILALDGAITSGTGTAAASSPATATASAGAAVSSATPAGSVPTFSLTGCATSQQAVATMLERLRLIDGVSQVTLLSSTKGAGSSGGGCPPNGPDFSVSVAFDALPSASATAAAVKASAAQTVSDSAATTTAGKQSTVAAKGAN